MLGEKIRSLRKENGISQEELAEKLGVSRQSISLWENGQTMPSMDNTISIADIFGVSTDTLIKENVEETRKDNEAPAKRKHGHKGCFITILSVIIVLAIGATLFVVLSRKESDNKLTAEEVYDLIAPCTVEINAIGDTFESTGTGCFIDYNGVIVTNYHVIESCHTINITTAQGDKYKAESVLGFDKDRDLAIIQVNYQNEYIVELNTEIIKTGEKVYTLGSSLGLTGTFSEGIISSSSRYIGGFEFIQITAPISSGNSGGPLVNEYGKVIGITTGAFTDGQNLNLAIPVTAISEISKEKAYSVNDFFLLSQGKFVEKNDSSQNSSTEDSPIEDEDFIPTNIGYFDSLEELEEESLRNPNTFKVPVIISVRGTILRSLEDNIYLIIRPSNNGLQFYRDRIYGVSDEVLKERYEHYRIYMIDDTQNRVLTDDEVIITGIYRHSAKTLSECTYEAIE